MGDTLALPERVLLGCGVVEVVVQTERLDEVDREVELHALLLAEWVADGEEELQALGRVVWVAEAQAEMEAVGHPKGEGLAVAVIKPLLVPVAQWEGLVDGVVVGAGVAVTPPLLLKVCEAQAEADRVALLQPVEEVLAHSEGLALVHRVALAHTDAVDESLGGRETLTHWEVEVQPEGESVARLLMLALGESVLLGVVDCEDVPQLLEDTLVLPLSVGLGWEVEEGVVQSVGEREGVRETVAHTLALVVRRVEGVTKSEKV